ncbi:hypothetical protein P6709_01825 [Jeotgalibacillus sp. ET6]|uniref:DUF4139 domain-containing protein n=1 Tax=Jeotgalibacillus sp. ET6 TaxID=3037260 RepID=UPI0024183DC0|nr:hypothetical protein [Jeotgalibacillus sp. ET6]MDG5470468.1 hypothetical protein [Jeotgalibacillus sp. ET6]
MITINYWNESQRKSMNLIVYENNFALIQEKRELSAGTPEWIMLSNLPLTMDESSLRITGIHVKEWRFRQSEGITKETILRALEGGQILFKQTDEKQKSFKLIASSPDFIIEDPVTKEVLVNPSGQLSVERVPEEVREDPVVTLRVEPSSHSTEVALGYLLDHLSWSAVYIGVLENGILHIKGTLQFINRTGQSFTEVSLQAMAGETNRIVSDNSTEPSVMMLKESSEYSQVTEEGEGDLHLYTIPFLVSLPDRQSTMIPFVQADAAYRLFYAVTSSDDHPSTVVEWTHMSDTPLSKGKITFYYGSGGREYFAGEDRMSFTPKGKEVQSVLGRAVDIDSEHEVIRSYLSGEDTVEDHVYRITSRKDTPAEVIISHAIYGRMWELIDASADILAKTANELQLRVTVQPDETKIVTFSIKIIKQKRRS